MGRLIDANSVYNAIQITTDNFGVAKHVVETNMLDMLAKIPTVEAIPKADYEKRLKADMVAMLEEIKKEIEELDFFEGEEPVNITQELMDEVKSWEHGVKDCKKLIQSRIDKLKENDEVN